MASYPSGYPSGYHCVETSTCPNLDETIEFYKNHKSIDPYVLLIGIGLISTLIFVVGCVWCLRVTFYKNSLNTARALDDNIVAKSNPAPVLGYPSNQMMLVSIVNNIFQIQN